MKNSPNVLHGSRSILTFGIGVFVGCLVPLLFSYVFTSSDTQFLSSGIAKANLQSVEQIKTLKTELNSLSDNISTVRNQVVELTDKVKSAEQEREETLKNSSLVLVAQPKAGPFGTVKGIRTNPIVFPDESLNPRLAKILERVAVNKELIVAVANIHVKEILELWFTNIKRVGIPNYLVVALDDETANFCNANDVPVYRRDPDATMDSIGQSEKSFSVSGLKFRVLREFLQLGYGVLLSDTDIVYLQNPFNHIYRDSDVESMSDGHDNQTTYGYNHVFDNSAMGWSRIVHTMRIWVYNSGFFYMRPTLPSIELLDRVSSRLAKDPKLWDQTVFNEELFYPSHPGYDGLHASKRTMDMYEFMNSKVLFVTVRKDPRLSKLLPVIVHTNYHPDKLARMKAVVDFYVNGNQDALKPFPDGSA